MYKIQIIMKNQVPIICPVGLYASAKKKINCGRCVIFRYRVLLCNQDWNCVAQDSLKSAALPLLLNARI